MSVAVLNAVLAGRLCGDAVGGSSATPPRAVDEADVDVGGADCLPSRVEVADIAAALTGGKIPALLSPGVPARMGGPVELRDRPAELRLEGGAVSPPFPKGSLPLA